MNFFYNTTHKDFAECECTLLNDYRPIVYNSKFIEDNFYHAKEQKGVFTLSKKNADIEKDLAIKEGLRQDLKEQYRNKREAATKLKEEQNNKIKNPLPVLKALLDTLLVNNTLHYPLLYYIIFNNYAQTSSCASFCLWF